MTSTIHSSASLGRPHLPSRRPTWLPALLAAVAALALYAVTLGGGYVYDDVILHEDARFSNPSQWSKFWTEDYMPGAVDRLYRPLTCLTFAVQYTLHGDRPWLYHLVNWLLHAGVAAAVAEMARRLMGFRTACVAGILFAIHPVHVEAVAGLVGRAELLCALGAVGAVILFLRPMGFSRALSIILCFAVALLSKEQGILVPLLLLALIPVRRRLLAHPPSSGTPLAGRAADDNAPAGCPIAEDPLDPPVISYRPSTSDKMNADRGAVGILFAALFLVTAAYLVFREQQFGFGWDRQHLDWTANPLIRSIGADRALMPLVLLGHYLLLLIAPLKLSLDYGTHVIGWTVNWRQPFVYLGAVTLLAWFLTTGWALRRRRWSALFCLLALAITYGMVSNSIILIGTIFGERLLYLPSAFFLILIAALLVRCLRPIPLTLVVMLLATPAAIRTFTYARLWNDPLKLYLANLHDHPLSMHLHGLAVDQYLSRGDYRAARAIGQDALRRLPDCWESYRMCVAADLRMHDFADAEAVLAHPDPRCPGLRIALLHEAVQREREKFESARRLPDGK